MFWQLASFGAVGLLATVTHVTVALLVFAGMGPHLLIANLLGATAAFFISFFGHARLTFRTTHPIRHRGPRFMGVTLVSFALASSIMALVDRFGLPGYMYALLVLCIVPPTNFVLAKLWAFAPDSA